MDTKRSQSLRKVATPQPSKTRMPPKTQSQASMTPSQASEAARLAANGGERNPLDALSRTTTRAAFERRSGLQDIDEEYLKRVTMPPPALPRHEHAAGKRTPQQPTLQGTNLARNVGGAEAAQQQLSQQPGQPQQPQQMQQQQQQQQQQQMNMTQEQIMAQAQQAQMTQPGTAMTAQQMSSPAAQPVQADMQQQAMSPQQVTYMPAAGEPELCTTCPHCQTTIYLTRTPETMPIQAVAGIHGQPEGANLAAAKQ